MSEFEDLKSKQYYRIDLKMVTIKDFIPTLK